MASIISRNLARNIARNTYRPVAIQTRSLHTSKPSFDIKKFDATCLVNKFRDASPEERFKMSCYALAVSFPLGLILSPSFLALPFDLVLGVAIPYHLHHGCINVLDDYVKKPWANTLVTFISILVALGFFKINLCGTGISDALKSVWRKPVVVKKN